MARELDVPAGSAMQAIATLRDALTRALGEYTAAHAPQAVRAAHRVPEAFNRPPTTRPLGIGPTGTARGLNR